MSVAQMGRLLFGFVALVLPACGGNASNEEPSNEVVAPPGYWDECGWGAYCEKGLVCKSLGLSFESNCTIACEKDSDCPGEDTCIAQEPGKFCGHIFEDNPFR
jgi:hypothetical protein